MAERHCASCSAPRPTDGGPDPCLGWLPGLRVACCGHGYQRHAYAVHDDDFDGSRVVRGKEAVRLLRDLGGNPPRPRNRWLLVSDERQWRASPARRSPVTDQPKSAPAMFQGVRPSPAPSPNPTEQTKADRVAATKASGAPPGMFGGFVLVPILVVGLIALAVWSPIAALIAGGALVILLAFGALGRSRARRWVSTTTRVRPDGSVTASTRPIRSTGWIDRRRTRRSGNSRRSDRSRGSSDRRSAAGSPGGGWSSRRGSSGTASRAARRIAAANAGSTNGARSPGSTPGSGSGAPSPRGDDSPGGKTRGRFPWSRDRAGRSRPGAGRGGGNPGSPSSPRGRGARSGGAPGLPHAPGRTPRSRGKSSSGGGNPEGSSSGARQPAPRNRDGSTATGGSRGHRPSRVPRWIKRAVSPRPPRRIVTGPGAR